MTTHSGKLTLSLRNPCSSLRSISRVPLFVWERCPLNNSRWTGSVKTPGKRTCPIRSSGWPQRLVCCLLGISVTGTWMFYDPSNLSQTCSTFVLSPRGSVLPARYTTLATAGQRCHGERDGEPHWSFAAISASSLILG